MLEMEMKALVAGWVVCMSGVRSSTYEKRVSAIANGTITSARKRNITGAPRCEQRPRCAQIDSFLGCGFSMMVGRSIVAPNCATVPLDARRYVPKGVPSRVRPSMRSAVKKRGMVSSSAGVSESETSTDCSTAIAALTAIEVIVEVGSANMEVKQRARVAPETTMVWP
jgi:hypothetical protein